MESIIKPKRPAGNWQFIDSGQIDGYENERWFYKKEKIFVMSAVEVATDIGGHTNGPEYHLSISIWPQKRCSTNKVNFVLKAFDFDGAEEDNHVPFGFVRNFWLPVGENLIGRECPCKKTEPVIVENKGDFIWRPAPRR